MRLYAPPNNEQLIDREQTLTRMPVWLVSRNSLILLATTLATSAVSVLFVAFLARELGAEGVGLYTVALTFGEIAGIVFDMGGGKLLTREISADEADAPGAISALLALKPLLATISLAGAVLVGYALGYTGLPLAGIVLAVAAIAMRVLAATARAVFHAYQQMEYDVVGLLAERFVTIGGGVSGVLMGFGLSGVLVSLLVGNIVDVFLSWVLVRRRFVSSFPAPDPGRVRSYAWMALPLFVGFFFPVLYLRANVVIIERILGSSAAGWFSAASQVLAVLLYIPQILGIAIFPVFAKLARQDLRQLGRISRRVTGVMSFGGVLLAMLVALGAGWLIDTLYSKQFAPSIGMLSLLAFGLPFAFASSVLVQVLVAMNAQDKVGRAVVIAAAFSISATLLVVPRHGVHGAACTAVITEILLLTQYAFAVVRLRLPARTR